MPKTIITLFLLMLTMKPTHDLRLAIFEIYEQGNQLNLFIKVDREDLEKALEVPMLKMARDEYNSQMLRNLLQEYFNKHLKWTFDGKTVATTISDITFPNENYVNIEAVLMDKKQEGIKEIKVTNTCLINEIERHTNIVKSRLHNTFRGCRLHKNRTSAIIDYTKYLNEN